MNRITYIKNNCPTCESSKKYKFKNLLRQDIFPTSLGVFIFQLKDEMCLNCGLIFSNPIPNQKSLNNFYSKKFLNKSLVPDYNLKKQLNFFFKNFNKKQKILEIGSSNNFLIQKLKTAGYKAFGYDLLNNKNLKSKKYDVILLNHVLEHTSNPLKFLKTVKRFCQKKTKIVIEVPDINNYFRSETSVLTCEHHYHFSKFSLIKLFKKVGFDLKFQEKKEISRKFSLRLIFESSPKSKRKKKRLVSVNNLNKKKINHIKKIYNKMLTKKFSSINNLKNLSKKIKTKVKNSSSKIVFWGANTVFLNCYLNFSKELLKICKLVDINYLNIKSLRLHNKKILVENPSKFIEKSNIFLICSLSWYKEIRKHLINKKVPSKNIYLAS